MGLEACALAPEQLVLVDGAGLTRLGLEAIGTVRISRKHAFRLTEIVTGL